MRTEDFWSGRFGDEYLARNRVEWEARVPFWQSAIDFMEPGSMLEVGCNAGWNLRAIQSIQADIDLYGVDINASAAEEARQAGFEVRVLGAQGIVGLHEPGSIDCVFTAGVLIHVAPEDIEATMRQIIAVSGRYVLAIEYMADQEEALDYRGHTGKLWKRPFGAMYQQMGLVLLSEGVAGGFDQCGYALLERAQT